VAVREAAYLALMERPDRRSRTLVMDAIRGFREHDPGLREKLLSNAVRGNFPLPAEAVKDILRTDASEHIRLLALDALSHHSSAREVAQAAATDASEAVRSKAMEILEGR
jgi:hypothetical protein